MVEAARLREQLTLFVPRVEGAPLEVVRRALDPVQAGLIAAHVTLCREDEIAGLSMERLFERLRGMAPLRLAFGPAECFLGHGILLPCIEGEADFQAMRRAVLGSGARGHAPHLTLAHPRNPRAAGNSLLDTPGLPGAMTLMFGAVSMIRQHGEAPWRQLGRMTLGVSALGALA
ncbi:2'-5' RNA ligase family protein [Chromobacterium paludis]|uniref:2'-5' RNA ligase family protein n=1 Tax=Chromobacterium paludis TaxID=2605945 RepID=A0A5C1DE27_9NEIS|nr:2'-5' RNA ligase family protein [Chromobacterium paludis]QEL55021.1 2'-5' RNA ligase family protein [Chromobacterium paludis]